MTTSDKITNKKKVVKPATPEPVAPPRTIATPIPLDANTKTLRKINKGTPDLLNSFVKQRAATVGALLKTRNKD